MKQNRLFYKFLKTKIGNICIVWGEETDTKILEIFLPNIPLKSIKKIYPDISPGKNKVIERLSERIVQYTTGKIVKFNLNNLKLERLGKFQKKVLFLTTRIPYGKTLSYKEIAKRLGNPFGARAIGQALAKNPFPIIIPCHRVIKSDGTLGGFGGGVGLKEKLLILEGAMHK